jgi:hypothetical protein
MTINEYAVLNILVVHWRSEAEALEIPVRSDARYFCEMPEETRNHYHALLSEAIILRKCANQLERQLKALKEVELGAKPN